MHWLLNSIYLLLLVLLSPLIVWRRLRHGRYRRGTREKLTGILPPNQVPNQVPPNQASDGAAFIAEGKNSQAPAVWFHAVSVGEIIQLRKVVDEFLRQSGSSFRIVITTSTDSGFDLAVQRFADCDVTWCPLDFSWAVRHFLQQLQPEMLVLMELELWPNLLAECHRRKIPVAIINARISDRSFRGYRRIRRLLAPLLARLSLVAAQSQQYADRLQALGASPSAIHVTGSIKFDGVSTDRDNPATQQLRLLLRPNDDGILLIAGSTQHPEEWMALQAWRQLQQQFPQLQLLLVPRHRERFDEVAELVRAEGFRLFRRSMSPEAPVLPNRKTVDAVPVEIAMHSPQQLPAVILLDTIGELSACWGLADIAFVGGSFGKRGGQNMIEPAAFGAAVMFGPNTSNFRDVVHIFLAADACIQLAEPGDLYNSLLQLLADPSLRIQLGERARQVVLSHQGAAATTVALLVNVLQRQWSHDCRQS